MDEDRRAAVFGRDEAIPLLGTERCHGADHVGPRLKMPTSTEAMIVHSDIAAVTPPATAGDRSGFTASPGAASAPAPDSPRGAGAPSRAPGVPPPGFPSSSTASGRYRSRPARAGGGRH